MKDFVRDVNIDKLERSILSTLDVRPFRRTWQFKCNDLIIVIVIVLVG